MLNELFAVLKRLLFGTPRTQPGVSPFASGQGPARLLIMRHAEKTGDPLDPHLSPEGQRRAEALVSYIPQIFGSPDFLIAARTSKKSQRPYDTLAPLADALGLKIKEKFDDEDVDALVEHLGGNIKFAGKSGVISWRHSDIPALLAALGAQHGSYPENWDPAVYNVIFEVGFIDGEPPRVRQFAGPL